MLEQDHIARLQGDRLAREAPGTLAPDGDRLLPKLAVAAFLGLGLAVIGLAGENFPEQTAGERLITPQIGELPPIEFDRRAGSDRTTN